MIKCININQLLMKNVNFNFEVLIIISDFNIEFNNKKEYFY